MARQITNNLVHFSQQFHQVKDAGNDVSQLVHGHLGHKDRRIVKMAKECLATLDRLENIPVKFNADDVTMDNQKKTFKEHLNDAEAVKDSLPFFKTKQAQKQLNHLDRRIVALKYRIEEANRGLCPTALVFQEDIENLECLAKQWKASYSLYQEKELCEQEKEKLIEACRYPEFAKLLSLDRPLREFFFKWALRDNCGVDEFVQFPATCARLKNACLSVRVGRFAKEFQMMKNKKVDGGSGQEKVLTLPFEIQEGAELKRKNVSILDENRIVNLKGNYQLTIKKVIDIFSDKKNNHSHLEFFGVNGISNWDTQELGWWNPKKKKYERIDLSQKNSEWWKQLPVFEKLTNEDLKVRYGLEDVEEGKWIAVVKSTRESLALDVDKSHGYLDVLIPNDEGTYALYPFGKFATKFPSSFLQKCFIISNTVEAKIEYPDANTFYAQRQQAASSTILKPEYGKELMEEIRKDLLEARKGNVIFQFAWENCAWWPQILLEKLLGPKRYGGPVPNYFRAPLFHAQPTIEPLKTIFRISRNLSKKLQTVVVRILGFFLRFGRGTAVLEKGKKVFKSLKTSKFRENNESYLPAYHHKKIQQEEVEGVVTFGNMFLQQYLQYP